MEKNMFKYIVTISTTAWDNSIEEEMFDKSGVEMIEITNEDPLLARKTAIEKAQSIEEYFEDEEEAHALPPIKWTNDWEVETPLLFMYYQIRIDFEIEGKTYCVFNNGDPDPLNPDEEFEGLQKEYDILKKTGIDLTDVSELIKYYDYADKKNKETYILSNGLDYTDVKYPENIYNMTLLEGINLDNGDKTKEIKDKKLKKKRHKKFIVETAFKSTYKNRFNYKKDTIEISLKTTSEISDVMENDINILIQKWSKNQSSLPNERSITNGNIYEIHKPKKGINASGKLAGKGKEFMVLEDSVISNKIDKSFPKKDRDLRNELLEKGIIDSNLRFTKHYSFSSKSEAANVIIGGSRNGEKEWKIKTK